jgi:AGZA family xanthine/uracil permease-like MFS transporter
MERGAVITATILAAAFGTLLAGLWANVPFAMAPGMGLNAFFAYSLVVGQQVSWETALGVVFVSGVAFFVLTLFGVRRHVVEAIPGDLRYAIAAGIGLFIAFIGVRSLGLIADDPATLVRMGSLTTEVVLGLSGLVLIVVLEIRRVRGAILIGILGATLAGMVVGRVAWPDQLVSMPPDLSPVFLQMDLAGAIRWGMWGAIFSFMFVDLFDSVGTVMACASEAKMVDERGRIEQIDRVLEADAVATVVGAALGTSTTTTYVESASGIVEGARTGLANVVTGALFLGALVVTPLIGVVPAFATAPALVVVGVFMFRNVAHIDFSRLDIAVPSFLTIVLMPLTHSISTGLAFGFIASVLFAVGAGRAAKVHPVMWVIAVLSALELALRG